MNYEKEYKEALERAKDLHDNHPLGQPLTWITCEKIFPVLKKSDDERIRKGIICGMNALKEQHKETFASIPINDCIAWLEKQNKIKTEDFGEFINELSKQFPQISFAKLSRIAVRVKNWLEKQGEQKPVEQDTEIRDLWVYIREWNDKFGRLPKDEDELASCIDYVMKRQKQLSWSEKHIADVFEKVGLAKIVREQGNDQLTNAVQSAMIELSKHQNPAWSEDDEQNLNFWLDNNKSIDSDKRNWLKSLKERIQPKQEWSEEDEEMYKEVLTDIIYAKNDLKTKGCLGLSKKAMKAFNWISKRHKSLRPQSKWKPSEKQMIALKNTIVGKRSPLYELYFDLEEL